MDELFRRLQLLNPTVEPARTALRIATCDTLGLAEDYLLPRATFESPAKRAARRAGVVVDFWITWDNGLSPGAIRQRLMEALDAMGVE